MVANVAVSFDKEVYGPGEKATLTMRAFDASGNRVTGEDNGNFFASSAGLSTSVPISALLFPFTTVSFILGKATTTFYLPTTSGLFTVSGRLGNGANLASALQGLPISAAVTILTKQDLDLAAARVSAANAETAANAALAAVLSLTAIVKSLVTVVAKIRKKFGIK